jgi:HEAT repeat protein
MPHGKNILTPAAPAAKDRAGRMPLASLLLLLAVVLTVGRTARAQQPDDADEQTLKPAGVATDAAGLLAFFRGRTLSPADQRKIDELVRQLDSPALREREEAVTRLVQVGRAALPALTRAATGKTLELAWRARQCINRIEKGPGPELPAAAARLLAERRPAGAVEVLLNYVPFADDDTVEEEVLAAVGRLGIRAGKVGPALLAALRAPAAERRAAAGYVLAQSGGLGQREAVRRLLDDPDDRVRAYAASGLVGKALRQSLKESPAGGESLVRSHHVAADGAGLVEFLRKQSPGEAEQARLHGLIRQLGSRLHRQREAASTRLAREGPAALPFLKEALNDADPEVVRRALLCIDKIQRGPGPALPAAVIRLLARQAPADATAAVLGYLPFAEDESVEEEALNTLCLLGVRQARLDPGLVGALHDPEPARRAAAAYVLGKVGTRAECAGLAGLLKDPSSRVRFRAAQGLLAGHDAAGVPALIALLTEAPPAWSWQVDDLLEQLAGERAPPRAEDGPGARKQAAAAWARWWGEQKGAVDFARLAPREHYLGLVVVSEYSTFFRGRGPGRRLSGRVWEVGRDGKRRWELRDLLGPMDAQALPGGRVLVAENMGGRVTERDRNGAVRWEYRPGNNPIACQRLPGGNTFIATYNQVLEVTPGHQVVHTYGNTPGFYIFSARRMPNGRVLCMTAQGVVIEVDLAGGREVRRFQPEGPPLGGWCSAEALPNGHYLLAMQNRGQHRGQVLEVDAAGKTYWQANYPGVFRATRLPGGNTLVVSMTTRRVAELDRTGAVRWEVSCEGRPWQARYR